MEAKKLVTTRKNAQFKDESLEPVKIVTRGFSYCQRLKSRESLERYSRRFECNVMNEVSLMIVDPIYFMWVTSSIIWRAGM